MVTSQDYRLYFGVNTTPSNFKKLEYISLSTIKSIITRPVPKESDSCYKDFKNALLEQINYYDLNSDLIDSTGKGSYTLGSYSESTNNKNDSSKSIDRLSPVAYEILLNCGLLQSQLGGCCLW